MLKNHALFGQVKPMQPIPSSWMPLREFDRPKCRAWTEVSGFQDRVGWFGGLGKFCKHRICHLGVAACTQFIQMFEKAQFCISSRPNYANLRTSWEKLACQTLKVGPVMYDKNLRPIKACLPHAVEPLSLSFQRKRSNTQAIHLTCWRFRNPEMCNSPLCLNWCFSIDPSSLNDKKFHHSTRPPNPNGVVPALHLIFRAGIIGWKRLKSPVVTSWFPQGPPYLRGGDER